MPIVSHTLESSVQVDGSTSNVLRMYDQDAREYTQSFFAPAGFDLTAKVNATIAGMDEQLKQSEFEQIVGLG
jgi:hypothetical protein